MPAHPLPLEPKQERSHATRRRLLDAAVDELVERGYTRLTTSGVARRAGVSRGALEHHFPTKDVFVAAAIRHLAESQREEVREHVTAARRGRMRVERALDVMFDQYRGRLFAAILDLSFAARGEPQLHDLVVAAERTINRDMHAWPNEIFEPAVRASAGFAGRWAMALSTMRGLAVLALLDHPPAAIDRQWRETRRELVRLLLTENVRGPASARRSLS